MTFGLATEIIFINILPFRFIYDFLKFQFNQLFGYVFIVSRTGCVCLLGGGGGGAVITSMGYWLFDVMDSVLSLCLLMVSNPHLHSSCHGGMHLQHDKVFKVVYFVHNCSFCTVFTFNGRNLTWVIIHFDVTMKLDKKGYLKFEHFIDCLGQIACGTQSGCSQTKHIERINSKHCVQIGF